MKALLTRRLLVMLFALLSITILHAQPTINRVEYYIDADPGFGNGTAVTTTGSATDKNGSFTLDLTALSSGVHIVGVRSRDANGAWSHDNKWIFAKLGGSFAETAVPNLVRSEYYINADPGFGNGTAITTTGSATDKNGSFTLDLSALTNGVHIVGVRSRDANGAWSHDNKWIFAKLGGSFAESAVPNLVRCEYYINTDPGFGNGTAITTTGSASNKTGSFTLDITGFQQGVSIVGVRSKDANGAWSHDNKWIFAKLSGGTGEQPLPNLGRTEYYVNTDPGFGNGTAVTTIGSATDKTGSFTLDITSYPMGVTIVGVRTQDANKAWSHDNKWLFAKLPPENTPPTITRLEYYLDTDPGFGKATPVAIANANNVPGIVLNANITGLTTGKHKIFYRTQDANGAWSHDNVDSFTLASTLPTPAVVVNSINKTTFCAGDSIKIGYHVTGTYTGANTFKAFLSNASGSFTSETEIGTVTSISSGIMAIKLPSHVAEGSSYKVRIKSSSPAGISEANGNILTIHDRPTAQTITGKTQVNGNYAWPYATPTATGSQWNWLATGGNITGGQTTNNATIAWSQPATASVAGNLKIIETNQFGCVGDTSLLAVTIYKLRIANNAPLIVCKADQLSISINADGAFDAGNIYTAELSNSAGSFSTIVGSATVASIGNGLNQAAAINLVIPFAIPNGTAYRIRVRSSNPAFIGDTSANISILKPDLGPNLNRSKCDGYTYNLAQDFTNPLLTYNYYEAGFTLLPGASVQAGTYNIIGTNANGCKDTAMVTLISNPSPSLGPDVNVYLLCPGQTSNLLLLYTTTGLTSANWNTASPTTAVPGIYRLIGINSFGCPDTAYATVILEVATWVGSTSNNWHTEANWNINKVPTDKTHVIIPAGTANACTLSTANGQAASIQIKSGAVMNTTNNRQLIISQQCATLPPN